MVFYLTQRRRERRARGPRLSRPQMSRSRFRKGGCGVSWEIYAKFWTQNGNQLQKKIESPDHIHTTVQLVFKIMSQGIFLTSHWCYWAKTEQNGGKGDKSAFCVDGRIWVNNHAHVLRPPLQTQSETAILSTTSKKASSAQGYATGVALATGWRGAEIRGHVLW